MDDAVVRTTALTKRYGDVVAVNGLDLDLGGVEIFALLGPSGCGKTTALRLVAGLERPDAGTITVGGSTVAGEGTWIPPERRRVGMVFQEWALFPHLDVRANVAFGIDERLAARRVDELMDLVRIGDLGARMPHELSGGQQQRVALARALAPAPAVLLLDEPFSNLDAQLRAHVREEVETVLRETGTPAVFVTHDQEEALSLADRVAVMVTGTIRQVGTPFDVYERPVDAAVARLVGDANVVPGDARAGSVHTPFGRIPSPGTTDGPCDVVLRPERLRVRAEAGGPSRVVHVAFYGDHQSVRCTLPDRTDVEVRLVGPRPELAPGAEVVVELDGPPVVVTSRARASADAVLS